MAITSSELVNPWQSVVVGPSRPFHVTEPSPWYNEEIKAFALKALECSQNLSIEHGPYDYLKTDIEIPKTNFDLYGHTGSVGKHIDNYGDTIGMILLSEGDHVLISNGHKSLLQEGSIFHLDSELPHETITSLDNGRLAFVSFDYGWKNKAPINLDYNHIARAMCLAIKEAGQNL
jgi:hypothetical protein